MKRIAVARIDEGRCIGCARCIEACPVDAIVGAHQLMHTVVEPWCIGCALCLPPCPVDCIDMIPAKGAWSAGHKAAAKQRARQRKLRLAQPQFVSPPKDRRAVIAAALARKRR